MSEGMRLWLRFHMDDVEQNAPICETCCKSIAAKGSSRTNLFHQLKRHPLQNGKKNIEWLIIPVEYTSSNLGNFRPPKPK